METCQLSTQQDGTNGDYRCDSCRSQDEQTSAIKPVSTVETPGTSRVPRPRGRGECSVGAASHSYGLEKNQRVCEVKVRRLVTLQRAGPHARDGKTRDRRAVAGAAAVDDGWNRRARPAGRHQFMGNDASADSRSSKIG